MKWLNLILCLFFLYDTHAQFNHYFLSVDIKKGLSQNSVTCFYEDKNGLMWIGTQDGLNSYDGKNIITYRYKNNDTNSLSNSYILKITEDANGYLWVGTAQGLNKLNKRTGKIQRVKIETTESSSKYASFSSIFAYKNDLIIWHNNALYTLNTGTLQLKKTRHTFTKGSSYYIQQKTIFNINAQGQIYSGEFNNQLNLIGQLPTDTSCIGEKRITANERYIAVYTKANQTIYLFDYIQKVITARLKISSPMFQMHLSNNNELLLACADGLVIFDIKLQQKQVIKYDKTNLYSVAPGNILSCFTDSKHTIWIGTSSAGLAYHTDAFNYVHYTKSPLDNDGIQALYTHNHHIYAAASSGLYDYYNDKPQMLYKTDGNRINAVTVDRNNNIIIAVEHKGIIVLSSRGRLLHSYNIQNSLLESNQILHLSTNSKGDVLICSERKFYILKNNTLQKINTTDNNRYGYVINVYENKEKQYYLSTNSGIVILDSLYNIIGHIPSFLPSHSIQNTIVSAVTQDADNNYWISTLQNGIYKLSPNKQLTHYNETNGLHSNVCYNIKVDSRNRIWTITNAGVHILCDTVFIPLNESDGLPLSYYTFGSIHTTDDMIVLGHTNGIIKVDAAKINFDTHNPIACLYDIKVNNTSIAIIGKKMILKAYKKNVSFELSCTPQTQFRTIYYQYKFNNDDWTTLSPNSNKINYTDLPFGKMQLQIRASYNPNQFQNAHIASYTLINDAPFHKSISFYILLAIMCLAILLYAYHLYHKNKTNKLNQQIAFQNQLQQQRQNISRDLHDNIGAYTSALITQIQHSKSRNNFDESYDLIQESANQIMLNLRANIWVLSNEKITVQAFSDRIKQYGLKMKQFYPSVQILFEDEIENDSILEPTVTINLFRIIQEALQNIFKHAKASMIHLHIKCNNSLKIVITDNGKGFDITQSSLGYGLTNMQERANSIHFSFNISSNSKGTTITLLQTSHE